MLRGFAKVSFAVTTLALLAGCDLSEEDVFDPRLSGTLSPDQASLVEAVPGQQPTPVILTFEIERPADRELGFQVHSTDPDAVLHEGSFRLGKGESQYLLSVLPNPAGTDDKFDSDVIIYVTGHGVRTSALLHISSTDPEAATVTPGSVSLAEAGAPVTLTLTLSAPATEEVTLLIDNPAIASLVAPGSLTLAAGESSVAFSIQAIPDANTFDEQFSVSLQQVNGTDQAVPLGASFDVSIVDDDDVDGISTEGSTPSVTFAGADTVWENGMPRLDDTITIVLSPAPAQSVAFQVATTDPDALEILDLNGMHRAIFTVPANPGGDSSTVRFVLRARQDPDRHNELATFYAFSTEGGEDASSSNPLSGGYANLSVARNIQVIDDDLLTMTLVRTDMGDTLFVTGNIAANTASYDVVLSGGVAPAGGVRVIVTSSSPAHATPVDGSGVFVSELDIPAGSTTASFGVVPALVPSGLPVPVNITVQGVLPSGVVDGTLIGQDGFYVAHADDALQLLTLTSAGTTVLEDGAGAASLTLVATRSGNLSLGAGLFQISVSNPDKVFVSPNQLVFAPGQTAQSFTVTARSDDDYDDHFVIVQVGGVQSGQAVTAAFEIEVLDDDSTPELSFAVGGVAAGGVVLSEGVPGDSEEVITVRLTGGSGALAAIVSSSDPGAVSVDTQTLLFAMPGDSASFTVRAQPDADFNNENVEILLLASVEGDVVAAVLPIEVIEDEVPLVATLSPDEATVLEGDSLDIDITLNQPVPSTFGPLVLQLESSNPARLHLEPTSVTLIPGQSTVSFRVFADFVEGVQLPALVQITASGANIGQLVFGSATIQVADPNVPASLFLEVASGATTLVEEADSVQVRARVEGLPATHLPFVLAVSVGDPGAIEPDVTLLSFSATSTEELFWVRTVGDLDVLDEVSQVAVEGSVQGTYLLATLPVAVLDEDGAARLILEVGGVPVSGVALEEDVDPTRAVTARLIGGVGPLAVGITSSDPTAFQSDTNFLIFDAPGDSATFTVEAQSDADFVSELGQISMFGSVGGQLVSAVLDVSVVDDEGLLLATLSPNPAQLTEGDSVELTLTLNQPVPMGAGALTIQLASSDPGRLGFAAGALQVSIAEGDSAVSFFVFATAEEGTQAPTNYVVSAQGYSLGNAVQTSAVVEVLDDGSDPDLVVELALGSVTLNEEADTAVVRVTVTNLPDPHLPFTMNVGVSDPTALSTSVDQLQFSGSSSAESFTVYTQGDPDLLDEIAQVLVSGTLQGNFLQRSLEFNVIDDDDTAALLVELAAGSLDLTEESDTAWVRVTVSNLPDPHQSFTLAVVSSDATALSTGVTELQFGPTQTMDSFYVTTHADIDVLDELVLLTVAGPLQGVLLTGSLEFNVLDDDISLVASLSPAWTALLEGDSVRMTLSLNRPVVAGAGPLMLQLASSNLSRTEFHPETISVSIAEGDSTASFQVYSVNNEGYQLPTQVAISAVGSSLGELVQASALISALDNGVGARLVVERSDTLGVVVEGDTICVRVRVEDLPDPHMPIMLAVSSSDPEVLEPQVNMLMFDSTQNEDSFKVVVVSDANGDADIADVTVFGTVQGLFLFKTLRVEITDDELAYLAVMTPEKNPIVEGETTKVTLALDQNVPMGLGDLEVTVVSLDTSRLALVESTVTVLEGESTACFFAYGVPCVEEDEPQAVEINARRDPVFGDPFAVTFITVLDGPLNEAPLFKGLVSVATAGGPRLRLDWLPALDPFTASDDIVYDIYLAAVSGGQDFNTPTVTTAPGQTSIILDDGDSPLIAVGDVVYVVVRARDAEGVADLNEVEAAILPCNPTQLRFFDADAAGPGDGSQADPYTDWQDAVDDVETNTNGGIIICDIGDATVGGDTNFPVEIGQTPRAVAIYGRFDLANLPPSADGEQILAGRLALGAGSSNVYNQETVFDLLMLDSLNHITFLDGIDLFDAEPDFITAQSGAILNVSGMMFEAESGDLGDVFAGSGYAIYVDTNGAFENSSVRVTGSEFRNLMTCIEFEGDEPFDLIHLGGNLFEDINFVGYWTIASPSSDVLDVRLRDNTVRFAYGRAFGQAMTSSEALFDVSMIGESQFTAGDVNFFVQRNVFRSFLDDIFLLQGLDQFGDPGGLEAELGKLDLRAESNEFRLGSGVGIIRASNGGRQGNGNLEAPSGDVCYTFANNTYDAVYWGWEIIDLTARSGANASVLVQDEVFRETGPAFEVDGVTYPPFSTYAAEIDIRIEGSVFAGNIADDDPVVNIDGGLVPLAGLTTLTVENSLFHGTDQVEDLIEYEIGSVQGFDRFSGGFGNDDDLTELLLEVVDNSFVGGFQAIDVEVGNFLPFVQRTRVKVDDNQILENTYGAEFVLRAFSGDTHLQFHSNHVRGGLRHDNVFNFDRGGIPWQVGVNLEFSGGVPFTNPPFIGALSGGMVADIADNIFEHAPSGGMFFGSMVSSGGGIAMMLSRNTFTGATSGNPQALFEFSGVSALVAQNNVFGFQPTDYNLGFYTRTPFFGETSGYPNIVLRNNLFVSNGEVITTYDEPIPLTVLNNTFYQNGFTDGLFDIGDNNESFDQSLFMNNLFSQSLSQSLNFDGPFQFQPTLFTHWSLLDVHGPLAGHANFEADALFTQQGELRDFDDYYRLLAVSSAIDAGNPAARFADTDGSNNDIGAFGGPGADHVGAGLASDEVEPFEVIFAHQFLPGSNLPEDLLGVNFRTGGRLMESGDPAIFNVFFNLPVDADNLDPAAFRLVNNLGSVLGSPAFVAAFGPVVFIAFPPPPDGSLYTLEVVPGAVQAESGQDLRQVFYHDFGVAPQTPVFESEPNDDIANADPTTLDARDVGLVTGNFGNSDNTGDRDYFLIENVEPGERFEATLKESDEDSYELLLINAVTGEVIHRAEDVFENTPYLSHTFTSTEVGSAGGSFVIAIELQTTLFGDDDYELHLLRPDGTPGPPPMTIFTITNPN